MSNACFIVAADENWGVDHAADVLQLALYVYHWSSLETLDLIWILTYHVFNVAKFLGASASPVGLLTTTSCKYSIGGIHHSRYSNLILTDVLIIVEVNLEEVVLKQLRLELLPLVLSFLQNLSDDLARHLFVLLDLLHIQTSVLRWRVSDPELRLVSDLREPPLAAAV